MERRAVRGLVVTDSRIISADSHVVEPDGLWTSRIAREFRDRAPRTVRNLNGQEGDFVVCEQITTRSISRYFAAGTSPEDFPELQKSGYEAAPEFVTDPAARIKDQDRDGVSAEVLYPSIGTLLYALEDDALQVACFRAYNEWLAEYCAHDPARLVGAAMISLADVGQATRELERVVKGGIQSAVIWSEPPAELPYSDDHYTDFFAVAQDLGVKLTLHPLTARTGSLRMQGDKMMYGSMIGFHEVARTLADMVLNGVLERFPRLTVVAAEYDVGWLPHFVWRLDHIYGKLYLSNPPAVPLSLQPSEYFRRQVYATFIEETGFIAGLDDYLSHNLMWSSDYPHYFSTFPRSQEFLAQELGSMPTDARRRIVHDTAAALYGMT
jgi:predicted TIM-barrel fold metal-dependent hydrolase